MVLNRFIIGGQLSGAEIKRKLAKAIVFGAVKGVVQYLLVFVSLTALIGIISGGITSSLPVNATETNETAHEQPEVPLSIELDFMLLSLFIVLSIISSVVKEFILYGPLLASIVIIVLLYMAFVKLGWGVVDISLGAYGTAHIDMTPVFTTLFKVLVLILLGSGALSTSKSIGEG